MTVNAMTVNAMSVQTLINQGFAQTNPSGLVINQIVLNRRGRLARTLVVLSLAIVMLATFGFSAGAGNTDQMSPTYDSFITVVVGPGETLWSLAGQIAVDGDKRSLVDQIISINSLATADVQIGQELRIPLQG
jgi:type IV secretory pathway VirB2 component (pilin)